MSHTIHALNLLREQTLAAERALHQVRPQLETLCTAFEAELSHAAINQLNVSFSLFSDARPTMSDALLKLTPLLRDWHHETRVTQNATWIWLRREVCGVTLTIAVFCQ